MEYLDIVFPFHYYYYHLLLAFTLCLIYFQAIKWFFVLSIASGISFSLYNLLFWFRNNLLFFAKDNLNVAGRGNIWLFWWISVADLVSFVHWDVLSDQRRIYIYTLRFSITLCIFKHVQQKFRLSLGHRPCVQLHC